MSETKKVDVEGEDFCMVCVDNNEDLNAAVERVKEWLDTHKSETKLVDDEEETCKHDWVYSPTLFLLDPPQQLKICSICGKEGTEVQPYTTKETYDEVKKRFS